MNFKMVSRMTGYILFIEIAAMLPPLIISVFYKEYSGVKGLLITIALLFVAGLLLILQRPKENKLFVAEGFAITTFGWLLMALFGGMPFYFSGYIPNFVDCFF